MSDKKENQSEFWRIKFREQTARAGEWMEELREARQEVESLQRRLKDNHARAEEIISSREKEIDRLRNDLDEARQERDQNKYLIALTHDLNQARTKAKCYGDIVHGCQPALEKAGYPVDASQSGGAVKGIREAVESMSNDLCDARNQVLDLIHASQRGNKMVQHCDNCGGSWLNDGINSGCHCKTIKDLRDSVQNLQSSLVETNALLNSAEQERDTALQRVDDLRAECDMLERTSAEDQKELEVCREKAEKWDALEFPGVVDDGDGDFPFHKPVQPDHNDAKPELDKPNGGKGWRELEIGEVILATDLCWDDDCPSGDNRWTATSPTIGERYSREKHTKHIRRTKPEPTSPPKDEPTQERREWWEVHCDHYRNSPHSVHRRLEDAEDMANRLSESKPEIVHKREVLPGDPTSAEIKSLLRDRAKSCCMIEELKKQVVSWRSMVASALQDRDEMALGAHQWEKERDELQRRCESVAVRLEHMGIRLSKDLPVLLPTKQLNDLAAKLRGDQ